jgi:RNA polymerase sigma factor (sigma-70 family)
LAAPGSNDIGGLIANTSGREAEKVQVLSDEEANELCEKYLPLAYRTAGLYMGRGVAPDEVRSASVAGLFEASRRYDPQRGPFGPYARLWCKGEISALFKDAKRHRADRLDSPAFKEDKDGESFLDRFLIDESAPAFTPDLSVLSDKERRIVLGRAAGESLSETGKALDLSAERVRQLQVSAFSKLRVDDPVKVGDLDARLFCDEYKKYGGNFPSLKHRSGYSKPNHRGWAQAIIARFAEHGPFKQIEITAYLSGDEKQKWTELLRNAETTDFGRRTEGAEKRFKVAGSISWKTLKENCANDAVERAQEPTPEEHLDKFLTHHQLEQFRLDKRPKLRGGTKVKKRPPKKCPPNKAAYLRQPPPRPVQTGRGVELDRHRNEGLRQLNGVPDSYQPKELSKQLHHHRQHAPMLAALRGNVPLRNPKGPCGGPVSHSWGHP